MNGAEIAEYLRRSSNGENVALGKDDLPDFDSPLETVCLLKKDLIRFKENMSALQIFAARICGVPMEELCLMSLWIHLKEYDDKKHHIEALKNRISDLKKQVESLKIRRKNKNSR